MKKLCKLQFGAIVFLISLLSILNIALASSELDNSENQTETKSEQETQNSDPVRFISDLTNTVLKTIRENQREIRSHHDRIYEIVNTQVLPHVDFIEMSKWVAGRRAWTKASELSRNNFIKEFKQLVVKTYANSLNEFANEKITFRPLRRGYANQKRIKVSASITQRNKPHPLYVEFRLIREDDSWKVYDLVVEGVSLLNGYQSQFSDDIRSMGLEYVTRKIRKHNRR